MNETKYLTVTEFAKEIGMHPDTVRKWDKDGILKPHHKSAYKGVRYYTYEQVETYKKKFFGGKDILSK